MITEEVARKILATVDQGLCRGMGKPVPGEMCVEAAVCYALGLPHSDEPRCVGAAVRRFKIRLNDAPWSCNAARAKGLRRLAVAQLGSDVIDQGAFAGALVMQMIRRVVPLLLRALPLIDAANAAQWESLAASCEGVTDHMEVRPVLRRAQGLARDARDARGALAALAALDARAALDALAALDAFAARAARRDERLTLLAEIGLECLVELQSPGCVWLPLCDEVVPSTGGVA